MRIDLHVHTRLSACGELEIDDILNHARSCGLDGVCITDHQTMDVRKVIQEGIQENGLCILFGMEYDTSEGDFLIFGPFEDILLGLPAQEMLGLVKEQGGAAIAAHPCRSARPTSEDLIRGGYCNMVESFNGRNSDEENQLARQWMNRYSLTEVAGSDAHTLEELGVGCTWFEIPITSRADLIYALRLKFCKPDFHVARVLSKA